MDKIKLKTKELQQLKGGQREITNTNWQQGCVCLYKNANSYNNENIHINCTCTCIVKPD